MEPLGPSALVLVAIAGGVGAVCRFGVDRAVQRWLPEKPLGVFTVNLLAALGVGFLVALGLAGATPMGPAGSAPPYPSDTLSVILVSGLLGGFSTFSTVAVDTVLLGRAGRWGWFIVNSAGMFVATFAAFFATSAGVSALLR